MALRFLHKKDGSKILQYSTQESSSTKKLYGGVLADEHIFMPVYETVWRDVPMVKEEDLENENNSQIQLSS